MKKLVLFDVDGTLIYHVGTHRQVGFSRFQYAIKKVFGINATIDEQVNYNGWIDPQIFSFIVKPYGIASATVRTKLAELENALHDYVVYQSKGGATLYEAIPEAVKLAMLLKVQKDLKLGLLTGNVELIPGSKLEHAGVPSIFDFGIYGGEADNRIDLAKMVFAKAKRHFGISFKPPGITVIGDAIPDIQCAQAIGANSIIAMTGRHSPREELLKAGPTLLVDKLLDPAVFSFFRIPKFRE